MTEQIRSPLGDYRGRTYSLLVRVTPSFNKIETFAVVVYFRIPADARTVQIARIDTSHGFAHFDRLYHKEQPKEPIEVDVWEAAALLEANWRRYATEYDRVHGR